MHGSMAMHACSSPTAAQQPNNSKGCWRWAAQPPMLPAAVGDQLAAQRPEWTRSGRWPRSGRSGRRPRSGHAAEGREERPQSSRRPPAAAIAGGQQQQSCGSGRRQCLRRQQQSAAIAASPLSLLSSSFLLLSGRDPLKVTSCPFLSCSPPHPMPLRR